MTAPKKRIKNFKGEAKFSPQEQYKLTREIFNRVRVDDEVTINTIANQYDGELGFILNVSDQLVFEDGDRSESMQDWQLFQVAVALKATKVVNYLLEDKNLGVIPRADMSDPELALD